MGDCGNSILRSPMIICELKLLDDDSWQDRIQAKMDKMNPVVI